MIVFFQCSANLQKNYILAPDNVMKGFLLILSMFLSCLFSGSGTRHDNAGVKAPQTFIESADSDTAEYEAESKDEAILPVRTAAYTLTARTYVQVFNFNNYAYEPATALVEPHSPKADKLISQIV